MADNDNEFKVITKPNGVKKTYKKVEIPNSSYFPNDQSHFIETKTHFIQMFRKPIVKIINESNKIIIIALSTMEMREHLDRLSLGFEASMAGGGMNFDVFLSTLIEEGMNILKLSPQMSIKRRVERKGLLTVFVQQQGILKILEKGLSVLKGDQCVIRSAENYELIDIDSLNQIKRTTKRKPIQRIGADIHFIDNEEEEQGKFVVRYNDNTYARYKDEDKFFKKLELDKHKGCYGEIEDYSQMFFLEECFEKDEHIRMKCTIINEDKGLLYDQWNPVWDTGAPCCMMKEETINIMGFEMTGADRSFNGRKYDAYRCLIRVEDPNDDKNFFETIQTVYGGYKEDILGLEFIKKFKHHFDRTDATFVVPI